MNNALKDTLIVMGGIFLITLVLNLFMSIDFYNNNATITYFAFGIVYFCVKYFTQKNKYK